ncbi:cytosolic carboxypeptidase 2 isoform X1 [Vespula pensylvanica]|uniref:cytosolic carboxypeptidase 2 isoform X1 n=3 Tax=Vespula pensylvanica TaxID=30213 RepID=UPI001CBA2ABA|nr:cytosolic carboxypeptidase 2 isoform X1 [Vespula pensylvanica]
MTDLLSSSKVRELQAMLFPVRSISGTALTSLRTPQESQIFERCRILNDSIETNLFSRSLEPAKQRNTKETLRTLSSQCIADNIVQEMARWPTECQVIPERVRHIDYNPINPEPFYLSNGKEPTPKPIDDELGTVIFRYCPTNVTNYFSRSCAGGNPILSSSNKTFKDTNEYTLTSSKDGKNITDMFFIADTNSDLRFESRFESGNLGKVVKISDTYYQLHLRRDLYTQRHTQWYYFQISNTRSRITYRLSIVNMCKEESLYNEGLRPLLYSTEDARTKSIGWRRCGENISYYKNGESDEEKEKHTLTFNISFPHDHDTVYLAHCYPYTYTDLQEYLTKIVSDPIKTRFTKLRLLCRTLAGNGVYYLTITAPPTYDDEVRRKRGVVITARVHPGETPSSWTMKGIIDFLTSESNRAKELRERFVFKLIPMLNPDGVIVGNNRCSLSGKDLNRQYRTVMRESYPSVWHTKLMIRRLLEECGVTIYCDLHAHSRKHNIFAYGCESKRTGCNNGRLSEQIFPLMLHKNAADKFSFENCKFHVEKGKEGTGRVVAWSMGVQNSYTMEASMGGSRLGSRSGTHFSTQDYEQIGKAFCETLLDFSDQDPAKEKLRTKILTRLIKEGSNAEEPTNIDLTDYSSDEGDNSESHASDESMRNAYDEIHNEYHPAPPPSPNFGSTGSMNLLKRRIRTKEMERKYLERRKFLQSRAVMDLHTTDPGSDLCYMTDWMDDDRSKTRGISARIQRHREGENILSLRGRYEGEIKKNEHTVECSLLPAIIRPRSLSLGEHLLPDEDNRKIEQRVRCHRLSRILKHPCTPSVERKVSAFRQQIWMGIPIRNTENGMTVINNDFGRVPLSWGISSLALTNCNSNNEILLRTCTEKLRTLDYFERTTELRKTKKKSRRKQNIIVSEEIRSRDKEDVRENIREDEKVKVTKKKRSRLKWEMAVNLSSTIKDNNNGTNNKNSFLSVKADSLKLFTTTTSAKKVRREEKLNTRVKTHKNDIVVATERIIARNKITKIRTIQQLKSFATPVSDSSNSEDGLNNPSKLKNGKRKQKKKKQLKKTRISGTTRNNNKKRAASAKTVK